MNLAAIIDPDGGHRHEVEQGTEEAAGAEGGGGGAHPQEHAASDRVAGLEESAGTSLKIWPSRVTVMWSTIWRRRTDHSVQDSRQGGAVRFCCSSTA